MSRWSTPHRKIRDAYYIHLDDEPYHMKVKEVTKASRRMKNSEAQHIHQLYRPNEITFSYPDDRAPLPSRSVSRLDVARPRLQGCACFQETNQTHESRFPHAVDQTIASSGATPRMNVIEMRDEAPMAYQKCKPYESKCLHEATLAKSPIANKGQCLYGEERRDQVEQSRFETTEDLSREESFPFDERSKNHCAQNGTSTCITTVVTTKIDSPPCVFRQNDSILLSTNNPLSSSRNRTSLVYENSDRTCQGDNASVLVHVPPSILTSPPRVSRFSSSKANFDLSQNSISPKDRLDKIAYPIQTHENKNKKNANRIPLSYHFVVGPPSMNIHRLRLPDQYLILLDKIVHGCEVHTRGLSDGWNTNLYSLTKQDIAIREVPYLYQLSKPILSYMSQVACALYGVKKLTCDNNQPHVLKYTEHHTGVELHHDKCDITMNLMMSRSNNYTGGGTYFPAAKTNVRLEFGEFLLHPGQAVHGGTDIHSGSRILMVVFADSNQE